MKSLNSFAPLLIRPSLRDEIDAERASRRLREFVRQAWAVVEPSTPFVPGWHIDAIIVHLEAVTHGQIRNLLINVPPRHMKSLLVSVFWPAWEWIRWPERRWLYSSYAASLSIRDSVKCRRLVESPWYQARWGDRFALTSDQNTKGRFDNDRSGYRLTTSVGGAVTGEGGDRIVCDDAHNVQEAESDPIRKTTVDWFDVVMSTRVNDPKTSSKVVVMQRCHQQDLSGHLLEKRGFEHLCLPAEYEGPPCVTSIVWTDPRTEQGDLLWPARFGAPEIEELKRSLGSYAAAGQLQQRPSPAEGGIFKRAWWRFYRDLPTLDTTVLSMDCSFKGTGDVDFVVIQGWGKRGADRYLLDEFRKRMNFPETKAAFKAMVTKWPAATVKVVEAKANGQAIIDSLRHEISGIIPFSPTDSKEARAHAVSPEVEAGNCYLPDPSHNPWVSEFIEELAGFPNANYDDRVDAFTQAMLRMSSHQINLNFERIDTDALMRGHWGAGFRTVPDVDAREI
jgi:predicted phage terminase large subunit-like protein